MTRMMSTLESWARARGITWAPWVEVRHRGDGSDEETPGTARAAGERASRGVFVTDLSTTIDWSRAHDLVAIPRRAMIACGDDDDGADADVKSEKRRLEERGTDAREEATVAELSVQDELALELLRYRFAKEDVSSVSSSYGGFAAYIASLPTSYELLQSWSEEEAAALQENRAMALAARRREEVRRSFARVKKELTIIMPSGDDDEAYEAYDWARATVSSRAVSVPFHKAGALCPIGDMFNYAPHDPPDLIRVVGTPCLGFRENDDEDNFSDKNVACNVFRCGTPKDDAVENLTRPRPGDGAYDASTKTFTFRSSAQPDGRRGPSSGEEIFVCYGEYTNLELLDFYGFTLDPDENPQDSYTLDVEVPDGGKACLKVFVGGFSWNDLADIRIAFAIHRAKGNEKQLRDIARRGGALGALEEAETFTAIREAAGDALLRFPTTATQDVALLAQDSSIISVRERLAVTWRLGIKRIIQRAYKWSDARAREAIAERDASVGVARVCLAHVATPKHRG